MRALPAYGEIQIVAATDAPVPDVVSRLRVDVFVASAGDRRTWVETRDLPLRSSRDWPASFSVYTTAPSRRILVRLRAYREGALRDYRGERYLAPPPADAAPDAEPPEALGDGTIRLLRAGRDETPLFEPIPESAIDRLVAIELREGEVREARVDLRVECAGTMADLRTETACLDARGVLRPATAPSRPIGAIPDFEQRLVEDRARLPAPRGATVAADGTPLFDEEVLVPGGVFVLGSRAESAQGGGGLLVTRAIPERVFAVAPLLVDRYEVTVGRYRDALLRGFVAPQGKGPVENDRDDLGGRSDALCSFSSSPRLGAASREKWPLTCIQLEAARAFCAFFGADLPRELEWEWIASGAGRLGKTSYPWGETPPTCDDAVFGRLEPAPGAPARCAPRPRSAAPVDALGVDVSANGVVGLAANVVELVSDPHLSYTSACWASAPFYGGPRCAAPARPRPVGRGSAWTMEFLLPVAMRNALTTTNGYDLGFRCVRRPSSS